MAFLTAGNRLVVALVGILVLVVLLFGLFLGLSFQLVQVDTATRSNPNTGRNWVGAGGGFAGEMLDQTRYIASWSPGFDGQKITIQGIHSEGFGLQCVLDSVRYLVDVNLGDVSGWQRVAQRDFGGFWGGTSPVRGPVWQYQLYGVYPDGSGVRVQYDGHCAGPEPIGGWIPLVHDEAYIESGIGSINWAEPQYTVGETAILSWDIPYVTDEASGRGWALIIQSTANDRVIGPILLKQLRGTYRYNVSTQDFAVEAGCRNELVGVLRNELWNKDFDTTTVIDVSDAGPTISGLRFTPSNPGVGQAITVSWDAAVNPQTNLALTRILIKYGFGGIDKEESLSATVRSFDIVPGQEGSLHVEVIAYDEGCRPSPTAELDITVGGGAPVISGLPLLEVIFLAAAVIAGAFLALLLRGQHPLIRIVVFIAPALVVLILIVGGIL